MSDVSYDQDEILILSGRVADEIVLNFGLEDEEVFDEVRNAAANAAESVMRQWTGVAAIPLPPQLSGRMAIAANDAAIARKKQLLKSRR